MARCSDCGQQMLGSKTCDHPWIEIDGEVFVRNTQYFDHGQHCHDCAIENKPGNIHHFGCDMGRCPKCGEQLIGCDCEKGEPMKENELLVKENELLAKPGVTSIELGVGD